MLTEPNLKNLKIPEDLKDLSLKSLKEPGHHV